MGFAISYNYSHPGRCSSCIREISSAIRDGRDDRTQNGRITLNSRTPQAIYNNLQVGQSNMTHQFAKKMELKANKIAEEFEDSIYGVKCWYSAARLFDQGAKIAFIGINPGGGGDDHSQRDKDRGYLEKLYEDPNYNSWLDESWSDEPLGEAGRQLKGHQFSAQRVFEILYGDDWEKVFRNTACFNVTPFRTPNINQLPREAWEASIPWFHQVIEHLKPKLIICNGNSEGRSPWGALRSIYSIDDVSKTTLYGVASLKQGIIQSAPLKNTRILALPHLTRFGNRNLFTELEKQRHTWDLP